MTELHQSIEEAKLQTAQDEVASEAALKEQTEPSPEFIYQDIIPLIEKHGLNPDVIFKRMGFTTELLKEIAMTKTKAELVFILRREFALQIGIVGQLHNEAHPDETVSTMEMYIVINRQNTGDELIRVLDLVVLPCLKEWDEKGQFPKDPFKLEEFGLVENSDLNEIENMITKMSQEIKGVEDMTKSMEKGGDDVLMAIQTGEEIATAEITPEDLEKLQKNRQHDCLIDEDEIETEDGVEYAPKLKKE